MKRVCTQPRVSPSAVLCGATVCVCVYEYLCRVLRSLSLCTCRVVSEPVSFVVVFECVHRAHKTTNKPRDTRYAFSKLSERSKDVRPAARRALARSLAEKSLH